MKRYRSAFILFSVFETIAVALWLATGSLFFLLNLQFFQFVCQFKEFFVITCSLIT